MLREVWYKAVIEGITSWRSPFENLWRKLGIDSFDLAIYLITLLMLRNVIIFNGKVWRLNISVFTPEDYEIKDITRHILKSLVNKFKIRKT